MLDGVVGDFTLRALTRVGMIVHKLPSLGVHVGNVLFENIGFDPPLSPAAHFDGREFTISHQGVGLRGRDVQCFGDIGQREEARHDAMVPKILKKASPLGRSCG